MSHKDPSENVFDRLMIDDRTYPVERLRLGLLLETLQSYASVNKRIRANPEDEKAHQLADILENQLTIAIACVYVSIPKEDRDALAKAALTAVVTDPDSLPKPPDLEDIV